MVSAKSRIGEVASPLCYTPLCDSDGETKSCKRHVPVFHTDGTQIGGALLYRVPKQYPVPVDDSQPHAYAREKSECHVHNLGKDKGGKVIPCSPEGLPAACKKGIENLKTMKEAAKEAAPTERFTPKLVVKQSKKLPSYLGDSHKTGVYKSSKCQGNVAQHPRIILERVQEYLLRKLPEDAVADRIGALATISNAIRHVNNAPSGSLHFEQRDVRTFENFTTQSKVLLGEGEEGDRYEYVNRQPALTLNLDLGTNDADYYAQAMTAAEIREQVVRSSPPKPEFEDVNPSKPEDGTEYRFLGAASQWVPVHGPTLEEEAWGRDNYTYTTWVPKAQWFADKVEAVNLRVKASRELTKNNVTLDPLRSISNVLVSWGKDAKSKVKPPVNTEAESLSGYTGYGQWATAQNGHFSGGSGAGKKHPAFIANELRYVKRHDVRQPFKEGWQTHATSITEAQWALWDKWLNSRYGITERVTLGDAERLDNLRDWLASRSGWFVPTVRIRNGVLENAGELLVRVLDTDHTAPVMESFKFANSCVCRFCRDENGECNDHFTSYVEMQKHEKKEHSELLTKSNFVPIDGSEAGVDSEGFLKVSHVNYGAVLFMRTLPDVWGNACAWVKKGKEGNPMWVKLSDLSVNGKPLVPPRETYGTSQVESPRPEHEQMLNNCLGVLYAEGMKHKEAMREFRASRNELLSENTYSFCDEVVVRPKSNRRISMDKNTTKYGDNWSLVVYSNGSGCKLYLGRVEFPHRTPLSVSDALRHCKEKEDEARAAMEKATSKDRRSKTAEWLEWAVRSQLCHEAGGSWAEDPKYLSGEPEPERTVEKLPSCPEETGDDSAYVATLLEEQPSEEGPEEEEEPTPEEDGELLNVIEYAGL